MLKKLLPIESCMQCRFLKVGGNCLTQWTCRKARRRIYGSILDVADFCPLQDVPQKNKVKKSNNNQQA